MRFKKFNRKQKECVRAHGLQVSKWYLIRETEFYLILYNPESKQRLPIDKFVKEFVKIHTVRVTDKSRKIRKKEG